jgi:uncharacterized protein (TIGR02646 family)
VRAINKGREPDSLLKHRKSTSASYDNYPDKDALRLRLADEQRGICCYCMGRIRPNGNSMKIEHWHSQSAYTLEALEYRNLLGACTGNEGEPPRLQHCDTSKGDQDISRNPANPAHRIEDFIRYDLASGEVSSQDPQFDVELNQVLHLNIQVLRNRRLAAIEVVIQSMPKQGNWSETIIRKEIALWSGQSHSGDLNPYCQVVVEFLTRKLKKITGRTINP